MKYKTLKKRSLKLILASSLLLSACGGENDENITSTSDEGGIIGTAKIIVKDDSKVEAKSKNGQKLSSSVNAKGKYKLTNTTPNDFLLRTLKPSTIDSNDKDYLYSIAHSDGVKTINRNLHSYTDLIVRNWFATRSLNIEEAFNSDKPIANLPSVAEINAIEKEIEGIVTKVLADYGVKQSIDLIATPFEINGTGFDLFLDKNTVLINKEGNITLIFKQKDGKAINVSINMLNLSSDLTTGSDTVPTTPANLIAYPQNATSIIIRWKASSDDKGVAGYHIYRNGQEIATTPYPVYIDTGLVSGTNYRYQVQAIDGRNQASAKTSQTSPVTPSANAIVALDGVYDVVTTSTSVETYCSGATGTFALSNETDIVGSVTSDTNSNHIFALNGSRDKNSGAVSGGFATTQGITYATIDGVIDGLYSNGNYSDIRGCKGVWVATKK